MSKEHDETAKLDRRSFLKGAAVAGAAVAAGAKIAAAAEPAAEDAKPAAKSAAAKLPSEAFITHPGSDFMADVLKA
ncbi:MAG TPA: twin-arginine translocation signal domain-containing protein, partial [Burkholderiales bacterium]|nr:twin-arginine translocation signal domain-containing protein [Burkholderiales bacterium]